MDFDFLDEQDLEILDEDNELTFCPYCNNISGCSDPRKLCSDCQEIFGHEFIDEL